MHQAFFSILSTKGVSYARQIFDEAMARDSSAILFREDEINQYALRMIQTGKPADAIQILSMSICRYNQSFDAYYFRSYAYFVANELDSAKADLTRALDINPDHVEARDRLNRLMQ